MKHIWQLRLSCALAALGVLPQFVFAADPAAVKQVASRQVQVISTGAATQLALDGAAPFHETRAAVQNARVITVPNEPTVVVTWNETDADGKTQPYYAVSLDGSRVRAVQKADYTLGLQYGSFTPQPGEQHPVEAALTSPAGSSIYIVQFETQPLAVFRKQIEAAGGVIHRYFSNYAYVVEMSPAVKAQIEALPYVRWVGPFHLAYRLNASLRPLMTGSGQNGEARRYHIEVFEKGIRQKNALAEQIVAAGGGIDVLDNGGCLFDATLTPAQLAAIARRDEVANIDPWTPPQARMNNVRIVGGANYVEGLTGWTGQGVRGEVMDNGCQAGQSGSMHPDFAGRLLIRGNTNFAVETHGTATFGIVFGSGAGNATGRGMMPGAIGYFNDWNFSGSRYSDIGQLITSPYNCVFQTNSWGFADTNQYTSTTREMDDAVFDFDIVVMHSQGNSGNQAGVEHAWGKNVVGVGGVDHFNNSTTSDDRWNGEGTIGPAADGRIKPDLCYYYDSIFTTYPTSTYTSGFGGTSAACPETAGHFGLMFQMWKEGIFGNPVSGGTVFAERPHCATARALMFNTAKSYTFTGGAVDLTRVHQGWGLADVKRLYDLRDNTFVVNETQILSELQMATYTVQIVPGQPNHEQMKVTLVYADQPGTVGAAKETINDLTLKLTSPTGVIYWGNSGLLVGNWTTSGGSADTLNTTENVFLQNPEAGRWTVNVIASDINQDGHVETPQMDADFALVITGGSAGNDCNTNGLDDTCDISCAASGCNVAGCGQSADCNSNNFPDECELTSNDCNNDQIPDDCQIAGNDCNGNNVPDECDLAGNDCNGNSEPDECDRAALSAQVSAPAVQTICSGNQATFQVSVPGGASVVWNKGGTPLSDGGHLSGTHTNTLTVNNAGAGDVGSYTATVTQGCISIDSSSAALQIMPPSFSVSQEPVTQVTVCAPDGQSAVFDFHVDNELGAQFQWYKDGQLLLNGGQVSGATSSHLQIASASGADGGQYTCVATNPCGASASSSLSRGYLVVVGAFVQQPRATCAPVNGKARFHVTSQSVPTMQYFWYRNGNSLSDGTDGAGMIVSGANTATLTLDHVPAAYNGQTIQAVTFVPSPTCVGQSNVVNLSVGGCSACPYFGDVDGDLDVDLRDMAKFEDCFGVTVTPGSPCTCANVDNSNNVVDLADWQALTGNSAGPF